VAAESTGKAERAQLDRHVPLPLLDDDAVALIVAPPPSPPAPPAPAPPALAAAVDAADDDDVVVVDADANKDASSESSDDEDASSESSDDQDASSESSELSEAASPPQLDLDSLSAERIELHGVFATEQVNLTPQGYWAAYRDINRGVFYGDHAARSAMEASPLDVAVAQYFDFGVAPGQRCVPAGHEKGGASRHGDLRPPCPRVALDAAE